MIERMVVVFNVDTEKEKKAFLKMFQKYPSNICYAKHFFKEKLKGGARNNANSIKK